MFAATFHAHVDDPARGEILAFVSLGGLVDEVFKGVVDDVEVGVEELPFLQRADADLEVIGGEADALVVGEDAGPFPFGVVEERLEVGLELGCSPARRPPLFPSASSAVFELRKRRCG